MGREGGVAESKGLWPCDLAGHRVPPRGCLPRENQPRVLQAASRGLRLAGLARFLPVGNVRRHAACEPCMQVRRRQPKSADVAPLHNLHRQSACRA